MSWKSAAARAAALALCALPCPAAAQDNVLILLADDVGVDMVGAYAEGGQPPTTPVIDSLAADGVLFRNAWAHPICSPARAALLTGRHGVRTGVGWATAETQPALPLSEVTLPELFDMHAQLGYAHAAFGKWHVGNQAVGGPLAPNLAGWGHFDGTEGNITFPHSYTSWTRVVDGVATIETGYATSVTVDAALAWLQSVPEPWVCYVAFHAGHAPFHAPPQALHDVPLPNVDPREEPVPFYRAMVQAMDTEIGRLLAGLGPAIDRTTILFAGDNGTHADVTVPPFLPEHAKYTPYEGGVNVPLIVSGSQVEAPGREVDALVGLVDLFATAADLAGIDAAQTLPGVALDSTSFLSLLVDPQAPATRDAVYSERFWPNGSAPTQAIREMRGARYKLIVEQLPVQREELYDLYRDPFEQHDLLAAGPLLPPAVYAEYADLRARLQALVPGL